MPADVSYVPVEGTTLGYATTVGGSYTSIPNLESLSPPVQEWTEVDYWGLGSSVKATRPGRIPEPGQLVFSFRGDPNGTVTVAMKTAAAARTEYYWKTTYVGDVYATHSFETVPGWIMKVEHEEYTEEKNVIITVTVKCNDLPTVTAGSN